MDENRVLIHVVNPKKVTIIGPLRILIHALRLAVPAATVLGGVPTCALRVGSWTAEQGQDYAEHETHIQLLQLL
jgi:hypothetical protein